MLTKKQCTQLMILALREARRGMRAGEVPIGSVIAMIRGKTLRVVGRGYNRVNALQRKIAHAEIVTFEDASRRRKDKRAVLPLNATEIVLVSTLEPCVMCLGAAMEAGVKLIVFGLQAPADNGTTRVTPPQSPESCNPKIIGNIMAAESRRLLVAWLKSNKGTEQAKFVEQLLALTSGRVKE